LKRAWTVARTSVDIIGESSLAGEREDLGRLTPLSRPERAHPVEGEVEASSDRRRRQLAEVLLRLGRRPLGVVPAALRDRGHRSKHCRSPPPARLAKDRTEPVGRVGSQGGLVHVRDLRLIDRHPLVPPLGQDQVADGQRLRNQVAVDRQPLIG
jgi:hypothetical protein